MKIRISKRVALLAAGIVLVQADVGHATDDPHGSLSAINCEQCHINHNSLGDLLVESTDGLISTLEQIFAE